MTVTPLATRGLFIDGAWTDGVGEQTLEVLNPATEEIIAQVPQATPADIDAAVTAARRAFDEGPWPTMSRAERGRILGAMADELTRRRAELVVAARRAAE